MKYNEAIDMILDGGEAYQRSRRDWVYSFYLSSNGVKYLGQKNCANEDTAYRFDAQFDEMMIEGNDWIVEKDGVVYEEYQICPNAETESIKNMFQNGFKHIEIKENGLLNEDWLEKKMLCFLGRHFTGNMHGGVLFQNRAKCTDKDCQFCFPEAKNPRGGFTAFPYAPKNFEQIFGIKPENDHIEQPPEKVTEEQLADLINGLVSCHIAVSIKKDESQKHLVKSHEIFGQLRKKLIYLLSLQEK